MPSTGYIYAGGAAGPTWTNPGNAAGNSTSTYASCEGTFNQTKTLTLSAYDFSQIPDDNLITKVTLNIWYQKPGTSTNGTFTGSSKFGSFSIPTTQTTAPRSLTLDYDFNEVPQPKSSLDGLSVSISNRQSNNTATFYTYIYRIGISITYVSPPPPRVSIKIGVAGKAKEADLRYIGVDGNAKEVQKVYVGVDNEAKLVYELAAIRTL